MSVYIYVKYTMYDDSFDLQSLVVQSSPKVILFV
jgi:hypothetical protein